MKDWLLRGLAALCCLFAAGHGAKSAGDLAEAEREFWRAAEEREHVALTSAYLLHFRDGRYAQEAADLYTRKTGEAWSAATAARAAWRERIDDKALGLSDDDLIGAWEHIVLCDINAILKDIEIDSELVLRRASSGGLAGDSAFRYGERYSGRGMILEARRSGGLLTYVMRAANDLTGSEVHIGVLNVEMSDGRLTTTGWEMNTAGAYCDLRGMKTS